MFPELDVTKLFERKRNPGTLLVLDRRCRVVGSRGGDDKVALSDELRKTVRQIAATWDASTTADSCDAMYLSDHEIAWIFPLHGSNDFRIAVYIEPYRRRATPVELADALGLLPTEYECIRLFALGMSFDEIADHLVIPGARIRQIFTNLQRRFDVKSPDAVLALITGHRKLVSRSA